MMREMILALPPLKHPPEVVHSTIWVNLTPIQMVFAAVCLVLVLWLAYRIGMVILRLVLGFLFLGLVAYGFYYLFFR